jgi:hypothetical protein
MDEQQNTVVLDLWVPLTIRIAWELTVQGISFGPELLHVAQSHVFSSLPPNMDAISAERLAIIYTREFIERLNGEAYVAPKIDVDIHMDIPSAWRESLERRASSVGKQVFHGHYRDGFSLQEVAARLNLSIPKVKKVRRKLHQFVYRILLKFDMDNSEVFDKAEKEWPLPRIECLLQYMALLPRTKEIDCDILLSPEGAALRNCPRLHHAYTLLKEGVLSPDNLTPPKELPMVYQERSILALQLNPEGRRYTKSLKHALRDLSLAIKGDIWLVSSEELSELNEILHDLAEDGTPPRYMLRGAVGSGVGMWSDDAVFGPLPTMVITLMRNRPWGEIDGVSKLPEPIPPLKKPVKTWIAALVLFGLSVSFLQWTLSSETSYVHYPITLESQARVEDVSVRFDLDDMAVIHILSFHKGIFQVLHNNLIHEKGMLATKDGRYFVRASVDRLLVVSTPHKIENWDSILEGVRHHEDPMISLKKRILVHEPRACVVQSKERRRSEERSVANIIEDWTY